MCSFAGRGRPLFVMVPSVAGNLALAAFPVAFRSAVFSSLKMQREAMQRPRAWKWEFPGPKMEPMAILLHSAVQVVTESKLSEKSGTLFLFGGGGAQG